MAEHSIFKTGDIWVQVGDSITEDPHGYAGICARWFANRCPELELRVLNAGVSGNKARDMLARFDRDVLSHHPDWISISVGVNDVWHGFYDFEADRPLPSFCPERAEVLEDYKRDLEAMLAAASFAGAKVILLSPTMIGEDKGTRENQMLADYVDAMRSLASSHGALYCPMNEELWKRLEVMREKDANERFTTDGVHMNSLGVAVMAEILLSALDKSRTLR